MTAGPVFAGWVSELFGMRTGYLSVALVGLFGCLAVIGWPRKWQIGDCGQTNSSQMNG